MQDLKRRWVGGSFSQSVSPSVSHIQWASSIPGPHSGGGGE